MRTLLRSLSGLSQPSAVPASAEDPARALAERTLHSTLVGILLWIAVWSAIWLPFFASRKVAAAALCLALFLATVVSLALLRRGHVTRAGWVLVATGWLAVTVLVFFNGGIASNALVLYVPITVIAAWVLGRRAALWNAGVFLALTLVLAILQSTGHPLPKYFLTPPYSLWMLLALAVALTVLPLNQVLGIVGATLAERRRQLDSLKIAEQALRESESRYRELFENSPIGVYRTTPDGRILLASPALLQLLGFASFDELAKRNLEEEGFEPDYDRNQFKRLLEEKGELRGLESVWKRRDGQFIHVREYVKVFRDAGGAVLYYDGTVEDITERKKAEADKIRLEEALRQAQKLESVGRLAGGVAHEFNNLLTVINGYGDLALNRLPENSPVRPTLREILRAGERAAELTQQLLTFSRKQVIRPKPTSLNAVVASSEETLRRLAGDKITLVTGLSPMLGLVTADPAQMREVLLNLTSNARDAMPNGGRLLIETMNVDIDAAQSSEHASEARPGAYVMLSVCDTGVGMDEKTLQSVFEPFFTTKEIGKGAGLGLSTIYGTVRQNDGWIEVSSQPGQGTTFRIYLPRISV